MKALVDMFLDMEAGTGSEVGLHIILITRSLFSSDIPTEEVFIVMTFVRTNYSNNTVIIEFENN